MGDAGLAGQRVAVQIIDQIPHLPGAAAHLDCAPGCRYDPDARGVVAPILKPLQAFEQDGNDVAVRDRADYAAHGALRLNGAGGKTPEQVTPTTSSASFMLG